MAIVKLKVCVVSGSTGDFAFPPVCRPGYNVSDLDFTGGESGHVTTEAIAAGVVGLTVHESGGVGNRVWVLRTGILRDVDTSGWSSGDVLWSDENGDLTVTPPSAARARIRAARVLTSHATAGVLWVDVRVLPAIGDLTGVDVSSVAELQVLQWVDNGAGKLVLRNVTRGDPDTVAPLDASARIPDQHLRWSRFLMMMGD